MGSVTGAQRAIQRQPIKRESSDVLPMVVKTWFKSARRCITVPDLLSDSYLLTVRSTDNGCKYDFILVFIVDVWNKYLHKSTATPLGEDGDGNCNSHSLPVTWSFHELQPTSFVL